MRRRADDAAALPDIAARMATVQFGFFTPAAIAGMLYMRTNPPAFWREATQVAWGLSSLAAAVAIHQGSHEPFAIFFRYAPIVTALYVNVVVSVRFRFAAFTSMTLLAINAADLWNLESAPLGLKLLIKGGVVWACALSLMANYRLEREQRRTFLLHERDRVQEGRIRHLAHHDGLTGLANRLLFQQTMNTALSHAGQGGEPIAVLCLDLDGFKTVNDTLGHMAGDMLLRQVADRLRRVTRGKDAVARVGGDEFVVLQTGVREGDAVETLAARIVDTIATPFDIDGHRVGIGASVGIALFPQDGRTAPDLLRVADAALYRAKRGGGGYMFSEPMEDTDHGGLHRIELPPSNRRLAVVEPEARGHMLD